MKRKLVVTENGRSREMLFVTTMAVGRDPECDISGSDPLLSRRHAELEPCEDHALVRDLGSRNGITVNGKKVDEAVLRPGDRVHVAGIRIEYAEEVGEESGDALEDSRTIRTPHTPHAPAMVSTHVEVAAVHVPAITAPPVYLAPTSAAIESVAVEQSPVMEVAAAAPVAAEDDDRTRVVPRTPTGQSSLRLRPRSHAEAHAAHRASVEPAVVWARRARTTCVALAVAVFVMTAVPLAWQDLSTRLFELGVGAMFAVVAGLIAAHLVERAAIDTLGRVAPPPHDAIVPAERIPSDLPLKEWAPIDANAPHSSAAARS